MTADTLTPDLIAAADDVADWAVSHAAEAGQHPTLPEVSPPSPRLLSEAVAHYAAVQAMGGR